MSLWLASAVVIYRLKEVKPAASVGDVCVTLLFMPLLYLSPRGMCLPPSVRVCRSGDWYVGYSPQSCQ